MADSALAAPTGLLVAGALVGVAAGSFLNVCIVRMPDRRSVVRGRSRCPDCEERIRWHDNVPVLSWLLLRGRCRHCADPISRQYPVIELATGGLWAVMMWQHATGGALLAEALAGAVFLTLLLGIAVIDARHYIIPDPLSLGGLAAALAFSLVPGGISPTSALLGAALGFGLLYATGWLGAKALRKPALGGGDIKMMGMVGAFLGPAGALLTIFLGALAGSVIFGPVAFRTGKPVPFGTFLAVGAAAFLLFGDVLIDWYLSLAAA